MSTDNQNGIKEKPFEEVTLEVKPIFQGKIINLDVETVKLPDGGTATREIVRHPGAVCVLARLGERILVVEQYRKALGRNLVEIPAGKLERGENPLEAAERELQEETGYTAGRIKKLTSFYSAPGFCDELLHLYLADELVAGESHPDEDEFLECGALTLEEAKSLIADGGIADAKTILAVQAWELLLLRESKQA
ncbi:NUDIX hydrolase [Gorillibacterium timonense]|uniref:NUDIX hydrolase n=1 Tax=Gorillibacterium timonense TaxID=1689269 RepID=UPI00071D6636|nr:NUDIX hydrolase [Gorillibacterium timonense]